MNMATVSSNVLCSLAGVYGALVLASLVLYILHRRWPDRDMTELAQRTLCMANYYAFFES